MISTLVMDQTVNHVDIIYTKKGGDARYAASKVKAYEYDFVAGIGGDGTINEVIEGIYLSRSNTPVAIVSAGTVNDFATYQLNEIIEIIGGGTPKRNNPSFWGGDIPWLSVVDFNNDKRYVASTVERITQQGLVGSSTKLLNTGDIIISARGTVKMQR